MRQTARTGSPNRRRERDWAALGEGLAAMHRHCASEFGWRQDNTIGTTPQLNSYSSDWLQFWSERRLKFQLQLADRNGYQGELLKLGARLSEACHVLFDNYHPQPSLLHGDLWSGNVAALPDGTPIIFDPAVYFGDRETDIAMTELFGGFNGSFYSAYNDAWPLDKGYQQRKHFYNLYHVLNHLNLFGGGYLRQAEHLMSRLLSELR